MGKRSSCGRCAAGQRARLPAAATICAAVGKVHRPFGPSSASSLRPADDAGRIDQEVPDELSAVAREDRLVDFIELEAVLGVEYGVGSHRLCRFRQLAGRVDACSLELRHGGAMGPFRPLAAAIGQELDARHAIGPVRAALRVAQKRDRRRPVAEIHAGTFHRRVDHGHGLDPCGAQGRLHAGKLHHLAPAERAVQPAKEDDQERATAQTGERDRSVEVGRGKRERGSSFSRLQRAYLFSHRVFPLAVSFR